MTKKKTAAKKKAAPARRSQPKPPAKVQVKRAHVHPETRQIPENARTQRRGRVSAADVPGTSEHAARHARRQAAIVAASGKGIKVQARADGYYGHIRRRPGDVFTIAREEDFSRKWMRKVEGRARETLTLPNEIIRQKHDETLALRHGVADPGRGVPADLGDEGDEEDNDPLGAGD